ncbi:hypothetical protein [Reinekea marinisedimentorum]|uniref:Uncharacterized protein n=1 Tax=Reinekea marinisedimentorum TaxID=230495 RepID=A0A4R3HVN8_9GAMM|nr:hypothetical protein [Reinekea marinisedimentorum]TCS35087.1 hypothetical protein BCF53_1387 [Reinekea marinisedimentorum]
MRARNFICILFFSSFCWSSEINVGGVIIDVPNPDGYSPVTSNMTLLNEIQKQFIAPTNEEFLSFIPISDVPSVLKDEIPDFPRRFTVQTAKNLINLSVTSSNFAELKEVIKTQNTDIIKKAEAQFPELMDRVNDGIKEEFDVDLALSISQMVPLPVHEESERILSYSSYVKYEMVDELGNPAPFVSVVTTTLVHIKGKILFLYSYAEESDVEWSRNASIQWAEELIRLNPITAQDTFNENAPSVVTGIDWGNVLAKAIAGAVIGLLIGFFSWVRNRKTSN